MRFAFNSHCCFEVVDQQELTSLRLSSQDSLLQAACSKVNSNMKLLHASLDSRQALQSTGVASTAWKTSLTHSVLTQANQPEQTAPLALLFYRYTVTDLVLTSQHVPVFGCVKCIQAPSMRTHFLNSASGASRN